MTDVSSRFIRALKREKVDRPPIWLMRQAGRYLPEYREIRAGAGNFLDLCYNPELAAEVTLQPVRRFSLDAAIVFSDILVIPHALGQTVDFREGVGPVLDPIQSSRDVAKLDASGVREHLDPVYQTLSRVKAALPENVALIGFAGAPWTIATYMIEGGSSRDYVKTKTWAFGEPDSFQKLFAVLEESIADHLIAQVDAGAQALQIFDSWAGLLPDGAFQKWCVEPIGRIIARVKDKKPEIPIIVFPRLAGARYMEFLKIEGVAAVSLDQTMSREWARDHLQSGLVVQGNLDPVYLVLGGEALKQEAEKILQIFAGKPFVFNLGHGVMQTTPPEHVAELCDYVAAWRP
ncbi:MAG: uroporphyrinogen decarboxylase [Proteobacteria bacterium]|nr:uroporphyrinogen decarboxylase [Pseudomonadota bacterium]